METFFKGSMAGTSVTHVDVANSCSTFIAQVAIVSDKLMPGESK